MKVSRVLVGIGMLAITSAGFAQTLASSGFDGDAEGWKAQNGATNFQWVSSGGSPGGFIEASDVGGHDLWFFNAPTAYLGDKAAAYGGSLSFALSSEPTSSPLPGNYATVQLLGSNGVLLAIGGLGNPTVDWTNYSVGLVANGDWRIGSATGAVATAADMQGVLSDLKALRINGDYRSAIETTGLDSVTLVAAPVPEPGTQALVLAGLGIVGGLALRRRHGVSR
jgi:hypothetical protein